MKRKRSLCYLYKWYDAELRRKIILLKKKYVFFLKKKINFFMRHRTKDNMFNTALLKIIIPTESK